MGKKSLLKSTSKKKKASKKEDSGEQIESPKPESKPESKKAAKKERPAQETEKKPAGKTTSAETAPKSKPIVKKQPPPVEPEAVKQVAETPKDIPVKKPLTVAELLALKFDIWKPDFSQAPAPPASDATYTAPAFVDPSDQEKADRIRALLALTFDMKKIVAAAKEPPVDVSPPADVEITEDARPAVLDLRPLPSAISTGQNQLYPAGKKSVLASKPFLAVLAVAFIYLVLIYASAVNKQQFFIRPTYSSIKVYQGTFSPAGKRLIVEMPGIHAPEPVKKSYTREEVFPLFHRFYTDLALRQLEAKQLLDLPAIKAGLENISTYAVTKEQKALVQKQMDTLEFISLLYKADVATAAGNLKIARKYLSNAESLALDNEEALLVKNKLAAIDALIRK